MEDGQNYSNWIEVDLAVIENNVRQIRQHTGVQVMAVVKANAYGHGAIPIARAAIQGGASWFGVARIEEALEIRQGGLDSPVLELGFTSPGRLEEAIANRISLAVWDKDQVERISAVAANIGKAAQLHLKVDTGMSRLGIQPQNVLALARYIESKANVIFEGVFTHYARADEADPEPSMIQEKIFLQTVADLAAAGIHPPLIHAANSAANMTRPNSRFNLVRAGIALYGLHPSKDCQLTPEFQPALSWKSVLTQVKLLPPGRGVSYGHEYTTSAYEHIGTVPVGYADGFRRQPGNQVLIAGRKVPVVGRVCMDQITIQIDGAPQAKEGDEVVILGSQEKSRITAEEIGHRWGTVNYEVVCGIGHRVPRLYV